MKILFLTQYYPPETGAAQNRISDWTLRLKSRGHEITVLTAMPNYPQGYILPEYRGRLLCEEQRDGIRVIRTWIYTTQNKSFIRRIANYLSFSLSSVVLGLFKLDRPDVIVVESPPLFTGISGLIFSWIFRAKMVFNVSDLWPESAVAMGALKNKLLISLSNWLESFIYRKSTLITGQSEGIVSEIVSRFPRKQVVFIPNGVDGEFFRRASEQQTVLAARTEFGITNDFVVGYAGLHGLAQGLETVLQAASILQPHPDIVFAFFGDGPEKPKLQALAENMGLNNVRFYPNQPRDKVPEVLAAFNTSVIPLKRLDVFEGVLPSKMFELMAASIPILLGVKGEARAIVEMAGAGICVEPEDACALAKAVLAIYQDRAFGEQLGKNGQAFVHRNFSREEIAGRFERLLLGTQAPTQVRTF